MVFGFVYKFFIGSITTTFAVYPALADPKSFLEGVTGWVAKIAPTVTETIGGVI